MKGHYYNVYTTTQYYKKNPRTTNRFLESDEYSGFKATTSIPTFQEGGLGYESENTRWFHSPFVVGRKYYLAHNDGARLHEYKAIRSIPGHQYNSWEFEIREIGVADTIALEERIRFTKIESNVYLEGDYPTNGVHTDNQWYVRLNDEPQISGQDQNLGNVSEEINYNYTVFDEDNDTLSVVERLNNEVIEVRNNVKSGSEFTATIPKEKIYELELGKKNTLQIEVSDGTERVYRNITFTRINTAPTLQLITENYLGEIISPFETVVKVHDIEEDSIDLIYSLYKIVNENKTVKRIKVNEDILENVNFNEDIAYSIPDNLFKKLGISDYELVITAIDAQAGESKETISFKRTEDTINHYSNKQETETMSKQIMIMPTIEGNPTSVKIEACNNCFDEEPNWEDVTEEAINMIPHNFINTSKTADKWGIQVRFQLDGKEVE